MKTILAAPNLLKIENITLYHDEVRLVVKTKSLKSPCPSCGWQSDKAHSRYRRHLVDLPWEGIAAKLVLSVRKFFCLNPECRQTIRLNLCHLSPEVKAAQELASSFIAMIRERRAQRLDGWISQVVESRIPELKSFADSLKQDRPAVVAALTYKWSNGMAEGQVNRLKLIKRAMYGRAKPDLLKARMQKVA